MLPALALALTGCGGSGAVRDAGVANAGAVKIGRPYKIRGRWYHPKDDRSYRETGSASWYGPNFHGRPTANGERFDQNAVSAAHRTLPLPSWVRVENLNNGRQIDVRVNDRGPFAHDRIIDLSRRAAQLLGMERSGTARVRVTRIYPDGAPLPPQMQAARPLPSGPVYVQVAALSEAARAHQLAAALGRFGPAAVSTAPSGLLRVRIGPLNSILQADEILAQLRAAGYEHPHIVSVPVS